MLRHKIEVEFFLVLRVANYLPVDESTWRRVFQVGTIIVEESLMNLLVHKDDCEVGSFCCFVVGLLDGFPKLRNLSLDNHQSHGVSYSISVEDKVLWVASLLGRKLVQCTLQSIFEVGIYNLLPSFLNESLRVVLAHLLICRRTKANIGNFA